MDTGWRARAEQILAPAGWQVLPNANGHTRVAVKAASDAALINRQLVTASISVHHLSLEQPSLEDIFLKLTEGSTLPGIGFGGASGTERSIA